MPRKSTIAFQKSYFSDESESEDLKDGGFVVDPEQLFDELPQPYRMIDKTLRYVFDKAWEGIEELEHSKNELGISGRIPLFDCAKQLSGIFQPELICCSADGIYTFVTGKNGLLYVVDTITSSVIATNEELAGLHILSLSTSYFDGNKHFVCTLQENGTAAVFALATSTLHLLKVFNEESNVKNSVATYIKISFDGNFIAVGWEITLKSSWLEIYKVPKESWLHEIEEREKLKKHVEPTTTNGEEAEIVPGNDLKNDSSDSENELNNSRPTSPAQNGTHQGFLPETSFTKPTTMLKIRAPTNVVPNVAINPSSAIKVIDPDVFPTGNNHVLLEQYFDNSLSSFKQHHRQHLEFLDDKDETPSIRKPSLHFLTPGKFVPAGFDKAPGNVNSVVVHWSDSPHGFIYSLMKSTKDIERKPDVVLATSSKIMISCISVCTRMVSFCLDNKNIITWNMLEGFPLNTVHLPRTDCITSLHILTNFFIKPKNSSENSHCVKLLACSQNGSLHLLDYDQINGTHVVKSTPSSIKMKDPVTHLVQMSNLPQLVIVQRQSGRLSIMDISSTALKCQVGLIKPFTLLQGFSYVQQTSTFFIKGGTKDEYDEEILPESVSIFTMNIDTFPALKCYYEEQPQPPTDIERKSFDKRIEEMENNRVRTQEKRERQRCTRWRQFESELNRRKTALGGDSTWLTIPIKTV